MNFSYCRSYISLHVRCEWIFLVYQDSIRLITFFIPFTCLLNSLLDTVRRNVTLITQLTDLQSSTTSALSSKQEQRRFQDKECCSLFQLHTTKVVIESTWKVKINPLFSPLGSLKVSPPFRSHSHKYRAFCLEQLGYTNFFTFHSLRQGILLKLLQINPYRNHCKMLCQYPPALAQGN